MRLHHSQPPPGRLCTSDKPQGADDNSVADHHTSVAAATSETEERDRERVQRERWMDGEPVMAPPLTASEIEDFDGDRRRL
ncbi:hypothetical protein HanRHA438_Chr05g0219121 [Helianthus annuus]|uniref:Uncharacterized protein n=1 Tax=Helianthus annuus TaxID=4232 RepID=A0A251UNL6_HELAN|nr:hypothetical protein HanXRQr2_Chr05g0209621 [Helianthus annuus]KAJ0569883.1 hypothetical protein HanHA300_Chr05g0171701 [Helianthus annuus]KAJ0584213.1 hypothetical protein HanHA89_Chr05g0185961 [Helianthus annuus]KAJ0749882.1 hypothetical protein HanLR1_Chr05g0175361 [Helianthus annuus]KAJ0918540.1 hypothetical protein HanRHA438_Chr05g0219121 [Helianthus annuus]